MISRIFFVSNKALKKLYNTNKRDRDRKTDRWINRQRECLPNISYSTLNV